MAKYNQSFDDNIKEKLEHFSLQDTPDWNFMQHRLEDAENDILFDEKIKRSFQELKADTPQIQWESFVARKNRQIAGRNKIILARVIESCLILLLLWTMDNIGISDIIKPSIIKHSSDITIITNKESESNSRMKKGDIAYPREEDSNNDNQNASTLLNDQKEKGFNRKRFSNTFERDENSLHKKIIKPNLATPKSKQWTPQGISEDRFLNFTEEISTTEYTPANGHIIYEISLKNMETLQKLLPITITPKELPIETVTQELPQHYSNPLRLIKPVESKFILLNMHAGLMSTVIISPAFNSTLGQQSYSQLQAGFQTALNLGFQTHGYMLESGLNYQYISYKPNQQETFGSWDNGYYKLLFSKIRSQIISIPVLLHVNLIHGNSWTLSAKGGLSLSVALKNDFILDTIVTYFPGGNQGIFFDRKDEKNSDISAKVNNPSHQGIINGGDFGINSFSNFVGGIRYQKKWKSKVSYFVELEFSKMLGEFGFGPNGDQFISTNLNTGFSLRL